MDAEMPQRFVQVQECIKMKFMAWVILKISNESEVSIPIQIFIIGSKIGDFRKISDFLVTDQK